MSTTFSYGRGGRLYRYYVSGSLDPLRSADSPTRRAPAGPLERLVLEIVTELLERPIMFEEALALIAAVELHDRSIQIVMAPGAMLEPHEPVESALERLRPLIQPNRIVAGGTGLRIIVDRKPIFRGGKASGAEARAADGDGSVLLRLAHRLLDEHSMSPLSPEAHVRARAPSWQRQRRLMMLGLLAPQLQKAILQGGFPGSVDAVLSKPLPLAWADQRAQEAAS
jgi:hypothetical protein